MKGKGHGGRRWEQLRQQILAPRPLTCRLCRNDIDPDIPYPHPLSKSVHCVIPVSRGGSTLDPDNLVPAHMICNQKQGNRMPQQADWIHAEDP